MKLNLLQYLALKDYIDAVAEEKAACALGRIFLNEMIAARDAEQHLREVLLDDSESR